MAQLGRELWSPDLDAFCPGASHAYFGALGDLK
jgi:hypothetical protein